MMPADKWTHAGHPVAKALRAAAMAYPHSVEDFPWGHPAYKIQGKKAFLFMGGYEDALTISMKLPFRHEEACARHGAAPTGYGLGKSGWVTFSLPKTKTKPDTVLLCDFLDESWRAVAPKKIAQANPTPPAPPKLAAKVRAKKATPKKTKSRNTKK